MRLRVYWCASITTSVLLFLILGFLWKNKDQHFTPSETLVSNQTTLQQFLKSSLHVEKSSYKDPPIYISTGVFIDSLKFINATDIQVSGYIWQAYKDGIHNGISRDFVLPEIVDTAGTATKEIAYRRRNGDTEVIGWYIEATLRQIFNYRKYPLDHKTVWLRIWHKDFDRNIILVPDFQSYKLSIAHGETYGVWNKIVLGAWNLEETYFDYELSNYNTDFGLREYVGQQGFPELRFNLILKRKFINALIINLVPLIVIAALLYSAIMLTTSDERKAERFGFDTSMVFGTCSALFFVVMLAHIQLREQFIEVGIVYMEHFYLLMYLVILVVAINTYRFSIHSDSRIANPWLAENHSMKLLYWPILLVACIGLTVFSLYLDG